MYSTEVAILIATLILYILYYFRIPRNFPLGPRGLPIIGSLPFIKGELHCYLSQLAQKYGGLFSIQLGNIRMVVLNDWKSMKEALLNNSELFSGRPKVFTYDRTLKDKDIITGTDDKWKEQKRFTLQHLRDFGFGKTSMEESIMTEVKNTIHYLENSVDMKRVCMTDLFFSPILSIIAKIATGNTFEINTKAMTELSKAMKFNFLCFKSSILNSMPYMRFIPGATNFNEFMLSHKQIAGLLEEETERHIKTYTEGEPRDFTDVYLAEIFKEGEKNVIFQKDYLNGILYNLYNAGVETVQSTLDFSFLYMAIWPEIQRKVQKEIDEVIGHGRFPCYSDRNLLPYTNATLLEIQRYTTIVPLSIPHTPIKDANLLGYSIPKGTYIVQNISAVHHDKHLWGDPETFRPERFLDSKGKVHRPEYFIPFSLGARYCLGVSLAKVELFLFFSCLLQRFSFHCITGEIPPKLEPIVTITQRAQPYHLTVKNR